MAALLRRRLVCFYCGHKSGLTRSPSIREWHCKNCDAVNYLDENGEITDPPAPDSPHEQQMFASQSNSFVYPDFAPTNNIFCATCVKNQNVVVQAIATYFPDDHDDPKYSEYEARFPGFKENLEKRYPQVCANCAPLANNRIESMTYLARAENLKLSLQRTRRGEAENLPRNYVLDTALVAGGIVWFGGILAQLMWHILGITLEAQWEQQSATLSQCVVQSIQSWSTDLICYEKATSLLPKALILALLSSWWHRKLHIASRTRGTLAKQKDYYTLQAIFLLVRILGYWFLTRKPTSMAMSSQPLHGFMAVFIAICTLSSLTIVEFRKRPVLADFKAKLVDVPEPITPTRQATPVVREAGNIHPSFPISALAGPNIQRSSIVPDPSIKTSRSSSISSATTTTVPSLFDPRFDDDVSEMDWTPTGPSSGFTPRSHIQALGSSATPQASPFRASLPPAPTHPYHKAAKPPPQPTFFRAPEEKRLQFQRTILGKSSDLFESGQGRRDEIDMAAPKLNLTQEDTGLESLFSSIFSLSDEPKEVVEGIVERGRVEQKGWFGAAFWTLIIAMACSVGVSCWMMLSP